MKMTTHRIRTNRTEQMLAETSEWVPEYPPPTGAVPALTGAPLFQDMTESEMARALAGFDEVRFPSGRRVVLEGFRGSDFFVILAGTVSVVVDGWKVAGLGPGDFFGEIAVLGDGMRSASVGADTPLHCLVLPNDKLEQLILDHPQIGVNLLHSLVGRLKGMAGRRQPPASTFATGEQ